MLAKLAEIRCFYRNLVRTVFVSFACVLSAISFGYAGEEFECPRIVVLGESVKDQEQYDEIVKWGVVGEFATHVESSRIPGTVSYDGMCSMTPGQPGDIGNPEQAGLPDGGKYCWCRVNEFTPDDGVPRSLPGYPWVFMFATPCTQNDECAKFCGGHGFWGNLSEEEIERVQQALYTMDDPECVYKLNYDCNDLVANGNYNNSTPAAQYVSYAQSFATYSSSVCPNHHPSLALVGWDWNQYTGVDACPTGGADYATSTSYPYPYYDGGRTLYARWCEGRISLCPNDGMPDSIVDWDDYWGVSHSGTATMEATCTKEEYGSYSDGDYGVPSGVSGEHCWCRANYYDNGYSAWVYTNVYSDYSACSNNCLLYCGSWSGKSEYSRLLTRGCKYRVRYECGNGSSQSPSIPSSGSQYFFGQTVNLTSSVSGCSVNQNGLFTGWKCMGESTSTNVNSQNLYSFTMPQENVTCTAQWKENPCGEDGTLLGTEILGELEAGDNYVNWGFYDEGPFHVPDGNGNFLGDVEYKGICSDPAGTLGMTGTPTFEGNAGCWCRVTGFTPAGWSEAQPLSGYPWVYVGGGCSENSQCDKYCKDKNMWKQNRDILGILQRNLYTRYICVYNLTYNCHNDFSNQSSISGGTYAGGDSVLLWPNHGSCTIPSNMGFNGWDCDNGVGTVSGGGTFTMPSGNVTCTAQWTRKYNVTFDCDNDVPGQNSIDGGTVSVGASFDLPESSWGHVEGCTSDIVHSFRLWECHDANGNPVQAEFTDFEQTTQQIIMPSSNVTCIAQWQMYNYPIFYTCGQFNNDATAHETTFYPHTPANEFNISTISPESCTPDEGYTFDHWNCYQGPLGESSLWWNYLSQINMNTIVNDGTTIIHPYPHTTLCVAQWVPSEYTVTYHGGSCNASASTFYDTVNAGASYTVENPECASSNSNDWLPTDGCSRFIGWSNSQYDSTQTASSQVVYGLCDDACATQTGSCGTISNVSSNIDLYAICDVMAHNVIYHGGNCGNYSPYTDYENALTYGMNTEYSVLPVEEMGWSDIPTSQFQGWSESPDLSEICAKQSSELYPLLRGGHTENSSLGYSPADECSNVDLYAVCCPLKLDWELDGGDWSAGSSGNQPTCEYGASAGVTGSIGYGQTPLQTPIKPGYTFDGWKVTGYSTIETP